MTNASRDDNRVTTALGILNTDGTTIMPLYVGGNHGLKVTDGTGGADLGDGHALRDDNRVTALLGVSSADGVTPVAVYIDSTGHLLVNSQ